MPLLPRPHLRWKKRTLLESQRKSWLSFANQYSAKDAGLFLSCLCCKPQVINLIVWMNFSLQSYSNKIIIRCNYLQRLDCNHYRMELNFHIIKKFRKTGLATFDKLFICLSFCTILFKKLFFYQNPMGQLTGFSFSILVISLDWTPHKGRI